MNLLIKALPLLLLAGPALAELRIQEVQSLHSIVIFAPHPDDEALMAAGIIESAVENNIQVKVVVVTNGDILGNKYGNIRENETVRAMKFLGLNEEDVIFLGYGDKDMKPLLETKNPSEIFKSHAKNSSTYAHRGICKKSYHECWTGKKADYSQINVTEDFQHILQEYRPDAVFTTSRFDNHPDHTAVQAFVEKSIKDMSEADSLFHPTLYEAIVHSPGQMFWPYLDNDQIKMPKIFRKDPEIWQKDFLRFRVINRRKKLHAINKYHSQMYSPWLRNYAKDFEPFQIFKF